MILKSPINTCLVSLLPNPLQKEGSGFILDSHFICSKKKKKSGTGCQPSSREWPHQAVAKGIRKARRTARPVWAWWEVEQDLSQHWWSWGGSGSLPRRSRREKGQCGSQLHKGKCKEDFGAQQRRSAIGMENGKQKFYLCHGSWEASALLVMWQRQCSIRIVITWKRAL